MSAVIFDSSYFRKLNVGSHRKSERIWGWQIPTQTLITVIMLSSVTMSHHPREAALCGVSQTFSLSITISKSRSHSSSDAGQARIYSSHGCTHVANISPPGWYLWPGTIPEPGAWVCRRFLKSIWQVFLLGQCEYVLALTINTTVFYYLSVAHVYFQPQYSHSPSVHRVIALPRIMF
jgi:hypothetical protein